VVHIFVFDENISFPLGTGSGFVYDAEGHIVTNNHVVEGGDSMEVVLPMVSVGGPLLWVPIPIAIWP
jgi:S1-C subfamily serine protease